MGTSQSQPEVLERRTAVRPVHLKHVLLLASEGSLSVSIPVFLRYRALIPLVQSWPARCSLRNRVTPAGPCSSSKRSLEAARVIVQNDPYWTGDVVRVVFFTLQNECAVYGVFPAVE